MFRVVRRVEHDLHRRRRGIEAEFLHQTVAVEHRHQHIRDDEIGMIGSGGFDGLVPIRRLEHVMAVLAEQCDKELAAQRVIVNDEDGCHESREMLHPQPYPIPG